MRFFPRIRGRAADSTRTFLVLRRAHATSCPVTSLNCRFTSFLGSFVGTERTLIGRRIAPSVTHESRSPRLQLTNARLLLRVSVEILEQTKCATRCRAARATSVPHSETRTAEPNRISREFYFACAIYAEKRRRGSRSEAPPILPFPLWRRGSRKKKLRCESDLLRSLTLTRQQKAKSPPVIEEWIVFSSPAAVSGIDRSV